MEEDNESSTSSNDNDDSDEIPSVELHNKVEYEEKGFSPVDIEIQILNERIMAIFKEAISKTEMALFLSLFSLKEINFAIRNVVTPEEFLFLRKIFKDGSLEPTEQLQQEKRESCISNTDDQIQEIVNQPDPKMLPNLSKVFKIFFEYPQLEPVIKKKIEWEKTRLPDAVLYLDSLVRLKTRVEERLTMSALEKLKRDIVQRNLQRINNVLKDRIAEVSMKLKEENAIFDHIYRQKDAIINHHQDELGLLKSECVTIIKKKILDSERQMMRDTETHKVNHETLVEQENDTKEKYDALLKQHLESEKVLRGKRFKVETQLTSWLQKYDKEVGDKQTEYDELTKNYEDEKVLLRNLQQRFDEQEKEYIPQMAEKEAEYQADLAIKFERFRGNYCATKIQRWWRAIIGATKKKKKGGKGKKKG